jgi:hypothetical protein
MKTGTFTILACAAVVLISTSVSLKAAIWNVSKLGDSGPGTLRDAVGFSGAGDIVRINVSGTIFLLSSITIPHSLYVEGRGPSLLTIDAGGFDRAFVVSGTPVFISGMTISNGLAAGANGVDGGIGQNGTAGADAHGGAILSSGTTLILSNCWITGNKAVGGRGGNGGPNPAATAFAPGNGGAGGSAFGGAVDVGGNFLENYYCTYSYNKAITGAGGKGGDNQSYVVEPGGNGGPGGNYSCGGAFYSTSFTTNVNCTFSGNSVSGGGGGNGGTNTMAIGGAGGLGGTLNDGGAIQNYAGAFLGCTIVSNSAFAGAGGLGGNGTPAGPNGTPGQATAGGVYAYIYAGCINLMFDTILADNYADTSCSNYYAAWMDEGYNFVGSTDYLGCAFGPTSQVGNVPAPIHPQLGALAQNGGGLPTHKTTLTGPVIDQGFSFGLTTDERGAPRPYSFGLPRPPGGDGSDIGAFERGSTDLGGYQSNTNMILTWPSYYGDFTLQSATNLQGTINWSYMSVMPVLVGTQLMVINPITNSMMFYRLISP